MDKLACMTKALFMWHKDEQLIGVMTTHVDDLIYSGTEEWNSTVVGKVCQEFKISKTAKKNFRYIGLEIEQNQSDIFVDQQHYIMQLEEMKIDENRKKDIHAKLNMDEQKLLRSACGQLLWVTSQTRPDMAFASCKASNYGKDATVESLLEVNKAVRHLKTSEVKLKYPALGDVNEISVIAYGDATHASLPSGESQGASIIFLKGDGNSAPIAWKSKKIERVTKSPLASEVSAIADAADAGHLVAEMIKELYKLQKTPKIVLFTDSKSLKQNLESTHVINDPRLRVDMARLKQMLDRDEIAINWVPSQQQLADSLTKKGASAEKLNAVLMSGQLQ